MVLAWLFTPAPPRNPQPPPPTAPVRCIPRPYRVWLLGLGSPIPPQSPRFAFCVETILALPWHPPSHSLQRSVSALPTGVCFHSPSELLLLPTERVRGGGQHCVTLAEPLCCLTSPKLSRSPCLAHVAKTLDIARARVERAIKSNLLVLQPKEEAQKGEVTCPKSHGVGG